ncbi:spike glycoprotein [Wencheng Sm shrew coronavirus]|uniref:spike glycoprotein n=1 Tax=Wencheng Sm shrew coronavirus TaxID=1508228 RepID=UPI000B5BBFC8|nr:spike glycoprotein [Wencheng Sm shrew coronavirus]ASF90450.1 spike glycoprotein [Wencheng Sm shrew coronavirus]
MKLIILFLVLSCVECVEYIKCSNTQLGLLDLEKITYSLFDLGDVGVNSTTLINGYFPSKDINNWLCEKMGVSELYYGQAFYTILNNVGSASLKFLIQPIVYSNSSYVIYMAYKSGVLNFSICYRNYFSFSWDTDPPSPISCAFNRRIYFGHRYIYLGVIWRHGYVKIITPNFVQQFELDNMYLEVIRVATGRFGSTVNYVIVMPFQIVDKRSTFLVNYNQSGYVSNLLNCSESIEAQLKCKSRSFELQSGVYEIALEERVGGYYSVVTNVTGDCNNIKHLFSNFTGNRQPLYAGNFASMSCIVPFNFSINNDLLNNNPQLRGFNGEFKPFIDCKGINPIGLFGSNGTCYSGMEWRYWTRRFSGYNMSIEGIAESFYDAGIGENECYGLLKGRQYNEFWQFTEVLYYKVRFMEKGLDVCYGNLPPAPQVNKCNVWTFNDITFEGVLLETNKTFNPQLKALYKGSMVVMIRVFGIVYEVVPCIKTRLSVIYNANNKNYSTLYRVANCNQIDTKRSVHPVGLLSRDGINTPCGCLRNAMFSPNITVDSYSCKTLLSDGYCVVFNNGSTEVVPIGIVGANTTYNMPILEESFVELALDHVLVSESEYFQTEMPVFDIDCEKYICDNSESCRMLLEQYAGFCSKITSDVKGNSQLLNANTLAMYKNIVPSDSIKPIENFGDFNMSMFIDKSGRSVLEDLLFDKIVTTGPGFYEDYYKCRTTTVKDLVCAQYYNGIMIIPPIQDAETIGMYGGIVAAGMTMGLFGGQATMGTWQIAMSARLNAVGVTQGMIMEDVQKLANGFNTLATSVSKMASVTADALSRIQGVVNANALQVELLARATMDNFGAISSNFEIIEKRLKQVQAEQQMDRVINGKMNALLNFVSNYKLKVSELTSIQQLVKQKVQECVHAQSLRNGFCGSGLHVMSIPQLVPNGVMFLHFSLVKNNSIIVKQTPGLCKEDKINCIVPKSGIFVSKNDSNWYITPRNKYVPKNITNSDIIFTTYSENFTVINNTIQFPGIEFPQDGDFDGQIKNVTLELQSLKDVVANMSYLDLSNHTALLKNISEEVKKMNITVSQFKQYVKYVKWPWYVWLLIVMALIAFGLVCFWIFMCTGCCGLCDCIRRSCCDSNTYEPIEKIHIQ